MNRLTPPDWMLASDTIRVQAALTDARGTVRFVGGCVRDALLGRKVKDIDLATDLTPPAVIEALTKAGIRFIPTGIDHGTITALPDHRPFEVTSLRRDVETDGRRAVVAYTTDWREDSLRRDFTVNALYADADGTITDFHGGLADLEMRHLRFIGDADTRIREDVLRILRFFRFHAQINCPAFDRVGLDACRARRDLLPELSAERVAGELLRLIGLPDPIAALTVMLTDGFLDHWLPEAKETAVLERLIDRTADPILRLAALLPTGADGQAVATRLRLSNKDAARLSFLTDNATPPGDEKAARATVYHLGADRARDRAILGTARDGERRAGDGWARLSSVAQGWTPPLFPISGKDAIALGLIPGPALGAALTRLERDWIDGDFLADRDTLLARLKTMC
ncbi:CCA tRNA nucleotidyltransferase [Pacificispira spongiicola]|nr:CCA tRNA nucleotidyltransferase [Pacificispira spongiicola]